MTQLVLCFKFQGTQILAFIYFKITLVSIRSKKLRSPPHIRHHRRRCDTKNIIFGLTCSVGADTRNRDYTRRPIRHPVRDIRRRCRIRFVCTRRPTATELVSARHRLMAVLRWVETPRPLKTIQKLQLKPHSMVSGHRSRYVVAGGSSISDSYYNIILFVSRLIKLFPPCLHAFQKTIENRFTVYPLYDRELRLGYRQLQR